jgi:hypothetical protein
MRKRTRQNIIEDLGFNHVERQVLYAGHTFSRFHKEDFGYDGVIDIFNENGDADNLHIMVQLKSIDSIALSNQKNKLVFELSKNDLEDWLYDIRPVILILFDAQKETAYFVDLQTYFQLNRHVLKKVRKSVKILFSENSIFNSQNLQTL